MMTTSPLHYNYYILRTLFPVFEGTCLTTNYSNYGNVSIGVGVLHASSKTLVNSSCSRLAAWAVTCTQKCDALFMTPKQ